MTEESVKVVARVRPLVEREINKNGLEIISVDRKENSIVLSRYAGGENRYSKQFRFDAVFDGEHTQYDLYGATGRQLIEQVIEGYNGTIFAYGQTGSGKTHTMMGQLKSELDQGIIPRCFGQLVDTIKTKTNKNFLVQCSYIEIYNEDIYDLLSGNLKNKLEIRESPYKGVFVKDVRRATVTNLAEMMRYLQIGTNNRAVAETLMNNESSRSHAIFTLYVYSSERSGDFERFTAAKFNLVDLAGSERQSKAGCQGYRLKYASKINLSLSALGNVISALVDSKVSHIPYRDSKLTRLLQDSLGGNTKTIMIANVSPCHFNYEYTLSTLRYASRAKYIQNAPVINEDPKDTLLREYYMEIMRLKIELYHLQGSTPPDTVNGICIDMAIGTAMTDRTMSYKHELLERIKQLEGYLIHPSILKQQLMYERNKREEQLSFMEKNYKNLEEYVEEMRNLLKYLRRKYTVASKEISELEREHEEYRNLMADQYRQLQLESIKFKAVLNTLFTDKQLTKLISLGQWESNDTYKIPTFYFKDKTTLAFPDEQFQQNPLKLESAGESRKETKKLLFNTSNRRRT